MSKTDDAPRFTNIAQIKEAAKASGSFWFSPSTVKYFRSRVESRIYESSSCRYWVESIRNFDDTGRVVGVAWFDIHSHNIDWASVAYTKLEFPSVAAAKEFITTHLV